MLYFITRFPRSIDFVLNHGCAAKDKPTPVLVIGNG
jgi:hypothetical protein